VSERAWAPACEHQEHGHQGYALRFLGDIRAWCDLPESESAKEHERQALTLADEFGICPLQADCHLGLGKLTFGKLTLRWEGPEQARSELPTAIELYRSRGMTFWLPQVKAALAQIG
jgi:hypothetical protein